MNDLVGYMGFLEIALKVGRNSQNWTFFRKIAYFGGDFKETHVSYEVFYGDQYCLEWCIWFVYQFWCKSDFEILGFLKFEQFGQIAKMANFGSSWEKNSTPQLIEHWDQSCSKSHFWQLLYRTQHCTTKIELGDF